MYVADLYSPKPVEGDPILVHIVVEIEKAAMKRKLNDGGCDLD